MVQHEFLLRFDAINPSDYSSRTGIFQAASSLLLTGELTVLDRALIEKTLEWFAKNLAVPKRFNRTTSKGFYRRDPTGIAWFKPTATNHLVSMRELATVLDQYGLSVGQLVSERPGYIVYEDEHQVIAEPFKDTL